MDDFRSSGSVKRGSPFLRAMSTPFDGVRRSLAQLAGMTFSGKRDTYEALGYQRVLYSRDYRARYKRGGIASRIVEALPLACWRGGGSIFEDNDPEKKTLFEEQFEQLNRRLKIWQIFQRTDILAGLGRYAIILIGAPGKMDQPLKGVNGPDDIKYLTPYSEEDAFVTQYDTDTNSERFGLPVLYALRRTYVQWPGQMNPPVLPAVPVHYTRVIHVADGLLDDHVFGMPRLERVWNLLDDLDKVLGGGAESFWKRADGGTQYEIDPELEFDPDPVKAAADKAAMQKKFDDFTHGLERQVTTRGIKINRLGSDVADLRGPCSAIMDQVSATTGIPQRILMGSEMGKLASSKDKSNWDDHVQDRRDDFCSTIVVRPFIDKLIDLGALPPPKQYEADWPSTDEMDQGQRVTAAVQISTLNKNEGTPVVTPSEIRTIYLDLPPLTEEQKNEIQTIKDEKAAQAMAIAGGQGTNVPGAPPSTDDPSTLAAAMKRLEVALVQDDLKVAERIVAEALGASPAPTSLAAPPPNVVVNVPTGGTKHIEYASIEGVMRPVRIIQDQTVQ